MGFWQTGYADHHESTGWGDGPRPIPSPPEYPCPVCGQVFLAADDLAVHTFDGHATNRPVLTLRGRECGRSRLAVIAATAPEDWGFANTRTIHVNGSPTTEDGARTILSSTGVGVISVVLEGDTDQEFEFSFSIADLPDLEGVDDELRSFVRRGSLAVTSIEDFIDRTASFRTARRYRDGLVNYFFGVLAREKSPESELRNTTGDSPAYVERFDDAVASLAAFDRPPAEAICGLVAFHYNQFDIALRKTRSPRVARISRWLATLLAGGVPERADLGDLERASLDYILSDSEIEKVLTWCSTPLIGNDVLLHELEDSLADQRPSDQLKLHVVLAERYLGAAQYDEGLRHVAAVRNSQLAEAWATEYRERIARGGT